MADTDKLSAEVSLNTDKFETAVAGVVKHSELLEKAFDSVNSHLASLEKAFSTLGGFDVAGRSLQGLSEKFDAFGKATLGAFSSVGQQASALQSAMSEISIVGGQTGASLDAFGDALTNLPQQLNLGIGPSEAAGAALEILSSRSEDAAGTQKILAVAMKASAAGNVTAAEAANLLTATLNSFGLAADDAGRVADVLFSTAAVGATDFRKLSASLANATPVAAAAGVSLEELTGAIAAITKGGTSTAQAVTEVTAVMAALLSPAQQAREEAAKFNLTLDETFLSSRGLTGALKEIGRATGGSKDSLVKILGSVEALKGALALTGKGTQSFADAVTANFNAAGKTEEALAKKTDDLAEAQKRLTAAGQRLGTSLGQTALPALTGLADGAAGVLNTLNSVPGPVKAIAIGLTGLAGVAATATAGLGFVGVAVLNAASAFVTLSQNQRVASAAQALYANGLKGNLLKALTALPAPLGAAGLALGAVAAGVAIGTGAWYAYSAALRAVNADHIAAQETADRLRSSLADVAQASKDALTSSAQGLVDSIGSDAALKKLGGQLGSLRSQRTGRAEKGEDTSDLDQLIKETEAKRDAILNGSVQAVKTLAQATVNLTGEELKQRLHEAEITSKSDEQHLRALEGILPSIRKQSDEYRAVEKTVVGLREKVEKAGSDAQKKAFAERVANELQAIQHSKAGTAQQIADLEALKQKYLDNGAVRRQIEDQVLKLQQQQAREAEDLIKRQTALREKAADLNRDTRAGKMQDLERSQERGLDVSGQIIEQLKAEGEATKADIRQELEDALKVEKNEPLRVELKRQAEVKISNVDADTGRRITDVQDRQVQDDARQQQEALTSEKAVYDKKIAVLEAFAAQGKDVQGRLEQAVQDRLKVEEASIRSAAAAEIAATSNVERARQIELRTALEIQAVRERAVEQLDEQNRKITEQKKLLATGEKGPIKGVSGFNFTLGALSSDVNDRSAFESSGTGDFAARQAATATADRRRRLRARTGAASPAEMLSTLNGLAIPRAPMKNFNEAEWQAGVDRTAAHMQRLNTTMKPGAGRGAAGGAAGPGAAPQRQDVNVRFGEAVVTVKTDHGNQKVKLTPSTDGRATPEGKQANRMSGKHGNNVRT